MHADKSTSHQPHYPPNAQQQQNAQQQLNAHQQQGLNSTIILRRLPIGSSRKYSYDKILHSILTCHCLPRCPTNHRTITSAVSTNHAKFFTKQLQPAMYGYLRCNPSYGTLHDTVHYMIPLQLFALQITATHHSYPSAKYYPNYQLTKAQSICTRVQRTCVRRPTPPRTSSSLLYPPPFHHVAFHPTPHTGHMQSASR